MFYVFVPESLISEWCEIYKPKAQGTFFRRKHIKRIQTNVENIDDANIEEAGDANTFNNNDLRVMLRGVYSGVNFYGVKLTP